MKFLYISFFGSCLNWNDVMWSMQGFFLYIHPTGIEFYRWIPNRNQCWLYMCLQIHTRIHLSMQTHARTRTHIHTMLHRTFTFRCLLWGDEAFKSITLGVWVCDCLYVCLNVNGWMDVKGHLQIYHQYIWVYTCLYI